MHLTSMTKPSSFSSSLDAKQAPNAWETTRAISSSFYKWTRETERMGVVTVEKKASRSKESKWICKRKQGNDTCTYTLFFKREARMKISIRRYNFHFFTTKITRDQTGNSNKHASKQANANCAETEIQADKVQCMRKKSSWRDYCPAVL